MTIGGPAEAAILMRTAPKSAISTEGSAVERLNTFVILNRGESAIGARMILLQMVLSNRD